MCNVHNQYNTKLIFHEREPMSDIEKESTLRRIKEIATGIDTGLYVTCSKEDQDWFEQHLPEPYLVVRYGGNMIVKWRRQEEI
jgi:hypothetical protein